MRKSTVLAMAAAIFLTSCGSGDSGDQAVAPDNTTPAPSPAPVPSGLTGAARVELLNLINNARSKSRICGSVSMPAVTGAVSWNDRLAAAAQVHSQYMKDTETLSHTGAGGSSVGDRVTAQGYNWKTVAENIGVGYPTVSALVQGWLASPGHCQNIMNGQFREIGVGQVLGAQSSTYSNYWTLVLASPV